MIKTFYLLALATITWAFPLNTFAQLEVSLRTSEGYYVVAEQGGGGIVNADRTDVGPWESFSLHDLNGGLLNDGDEVAFQTHDRDHYLVAEFGGGNVVRANRVAIGPWETFIVVKLNGGGRVRNGDQIALRTNDGLHYVVAELGGGSRVNSNRVAIGPWETFTIEIRGGGNARSGVVRKCGWSVCDDDGPFNALGATMMWAAWAYKNDRQKLEDNLAFLRDNGFDYIRALGVVGRLPWWEGRVIDWRWPDYDQVIAGLTDLAYDKYGIRIEWTLIGDGDQMIPNTNDRYNLVERFLAMSRGREHKIMHFEIGNEAWQNGFSVGSGYTLLGRLARYMNDRTDILVAASAPSGMENEGSYCDEAASYNNGNVDLWTFHYDRSSRAVDGFWRHVRQPWESCGQFASNNEPMGPGSSVEKTTNPYHLVAAAINSYISNVSMYVWHTESGVWGGTIKNLEGKSDLYENPSGTNFGVIRALLPNDLANWTRQNTYQNRNHPFVVYAGGQADRIWPEGYNDGVVRAYATVRGSDFVVLPIGIRNFVRMRAQRAMTFKVYDIVTGDLLTEPTLNQGDFFTLNEDGKGTYLIIGRYL